MSINRLVEYSKDGVESKRVVTRYDNGKIKLEEEFYRNLPVGNQFAYDENGKLVENYFFDHRGNLRFKYLWNEELNTYVAEGKTIYLQGNFLENYTEHDTIRIIPVFANPFKSHVDITFKINDEVIEKEYQYDADSPLLLYEVLKGQNMIKVLSVIYDKQNARIAADSIILDIEAG